MTEDFDGFAPPPFNTDNALQQMKRSLRDLKLSERGNGFELRGRRVVEMVVADGTITVRMARKPALTPVWDTQTLKSTNDVRKCIDELKKRLARWDQEDT